MALVGVLCAEVKPETVGAVRSMVIMVEAVDKLAGPVLPAMSLMAAMARRG